MKPQDTSKRDAACALGIRAAREAFPTTVEGYAARNAKRRAIQIAQDLRDLADRIERSAEDFDRVGEGGIKSYTSVAADMTQRLYNDLPSMGFGQLIEFAGEADHARGKGE